MVRMRGHHRRVPAGRWSGQRGQLRAGLNTAAVALTAFGNVPVERAAYLVEILYGQRVSAGFVDRAGCLTGRAARCQTGQAADRTPG